ncbi:MAG: hypothetical protein ACLUCE_09350 [Streptococcus sp.]
MTRKEQERIEQEHYQAQMQFENFESELNAARELLINTPIISQI